MINRILFALIATIIIVLLIMWFATLTSDDVRNLEATQTQNALEATWDAEFWATVTAEAE